MTERIFRPPYRYEYREHGPCTIYDAKDTGWICRVKETLPHKREIAAAIVVALNHAAREEEARLPTGDPVLDGMRAYFADKSPG